MSGLWKVSNSVLFVLIITILLHHLSYPQQKKQLEEMSLEELMNIEITTAGRKLNKISDTPASVVLITREEIETYGYSSVSEILDNIPGLYSIDDYSEYGSSFGIRGFWSGVANNNMIILINGISQINDLQSNYPFPKITVPVEAIERIEVIRGPMSVIYGNGAFYGVINIFTDNSFYPFSKDKYDLMQNYNQISVSMGSESTRKIFLRASSQKENFTYTFNASLYDTKGINQDLSKMVVNPETLINYGISKDSTTGGSLENSEKFLNFSGRFHDFFIHFFYNESLKEPYYLMPSFSEGNSSDSNSLNISFGYTKTVNKNFAINGKLTYIQNREFQKYDYLFTDFFGIQQLESNAWEAELNTFFKPDSPIELTAGVYYRRVMKAINLYDLPSFGTSTLVNNYFYLPDNEKIETKAIFAQARYQFFNKLSLIGGIRLEQMPKYRLAADLAGGTGDYLTIENTYDRSEIEFIPRLALIYKLNDQNFIKLLYGSAINRPSYFQNTLNLLLEPGVGALKPETIHTLELNYIGSFSNLLSINFSIFHNSLRNLITRVGELDENGDYQTWSANAGKLITKGIEASLYLKPSVHFNLDTSFIYQNTTDEMTGRDKITVAYSPKFLGYAKASYHLKNFKVCLLGRYVGSMESFWDESINKRIGDKTEGYLTLGLNLRIHDFLAKGFFCAFKISNILNEEIRYPTFTNNVWAVRGTLGHGRTILLTIGMKF